MKASKAIQAAINRASAKPDNNSANPNRKNEMGFGQWDDWDNGHVDNEVSTEIKIEFNNSNTVYSKDHPLHSLR